MKSSTFTTKDGAKISYRIHGENHKTTPFVMFNGMSAVMEDWSPLVEELGKSRTGETHVFHSTQKLVLPLQIAFFTDPFTLPVSFPHPPKF